MPTILIKKSDTPGAAPTGSDLTNLAGGAEIAVNTADKRVFSMNSSSAIIELGTNPGSLTTADASATVLRSGSATITDLIATSASITTLTATSASVTNLTATSLVLSNLSIASANVTTLTSGSATITNLLATSLTVSSGSTLNGGVVVNETGADVDFRIESDTNANAFFLDGANGNVGFGTNSPGNYANYRNVAISGTTGGNIDLLNGSTVVGNLFNTSTDFVVLNAANGPLRLGTNNTEKARIDASGNLGLGVTPSAWDSNRRVFQVGGSCALWASTTGSGTSFASNNLYFDGANFRYLNTAHATYYAQSSTGIHSWAVAASGTAGNTATLTENMVLDASGNLGVGLSSPENRLHVVGSNGDIVRVAGANENFYVNCGSQGSYVGNGASAGGETIYFNAVSDYMAFFTASTERARITSGGDFFSYNSTDGIVSASSLAAGTSNNLFLGRHSATSTTTGTSSFVVRTNGNVLNTNNSYGAISDEKMKQDIVDASSQWDDIKGLRVRKFRYKADPAAPLQIGVVAQELEDVSPGLIDESVDRDEEGNDLGTTTKSVKYSVLYMKAIKALQEAMTRIEALEAEVAALKGAN